MAVTFQLLLEVIPLYLLFTKGKGDFFGHGGGGRATPPDRGGRATPPDLLLTKAGQSIFFKFLRI